MTPEAAEVFAAPDTAPGLSVLMVSASFHPYVGGAEKQALGLSVALKNRGVRVRVLTRRRDDLPAEEEVRGIPVSRLPAPGSGLINAVSFMLSLFLYFLKNRKDYEVIHVHLGGSPALPAALAGRVLRKRVVIKLGGGRGIGELAVSSRTLTGRLKLFCLERLRPQFVAVTRDLSKELAAHGLKDVSVRVQGNGVDVERYRPVELAAKKEIRCELGWPEGLCFLYVGRFSAEKRLLTFLETYLELAVKSGTPTFAALVGSGPEEGYIRELASRWPGRVILHAPMEDIHRAYAAADIFVLPSVSEGLSNALLEAMSTGLAVLGSRVGGTAEVIKEGENGVLFDAADQEELQAGMRRYLAEPDLAVKFGAEARRTAEGFSIERTAEAYESIYRGGE